MTMPIWHSTTINPFMHLLLTNQQYKNGDKNCMMFIILSLHLQSRQSKAHIVSHLPMERGAASTIYNGRFIEAATWIFHAPLYIYQ